MNEVLKTAADIQDFCESQKWPFCIIGGIALMRWGEPRETVDVDISLLTGFGGEDPFVEALLRQYESRIKEPAEFALRNRVLLIRGKEGVGIDVALAALPFEETAIQRSSKFAFISAVELRTCSAEDLIVFKAFAARPKDWLDIEGVLLRQTSSLDWRYIHEQLRPLVELKGAPEILTQLERKRVEFSS